jgi:AcrR family transcriptional regulator
MSRPYKSAIKEDQSRATIGKLIEVASEEFSRKGFSVASTETIVHRTGVTRGALCHHFKDKQNLFLAVSRENQRDIGREIEAVAAPHAHPWNQLVAGCRAFWKPVPNPIDSKLWSLTARRF